MSFFQVFEPLKSFESGENAGWKALFSEEKNLNESIKFNVDFTNDKIFS
jgi:hypothetical protein